MTTAAAPNGLVLFHTPGTCSRVALNALEEAGLAYEDRAIDIFKGAQRRPDYLAVNPKGKVPALLIDGVVLTETPAILAWLSAEHPDAALLPAGSPLEQAQALADVVWCSSTLHPLASAIRMPQRKTTGDPAPVRAAAIEQITPALDSMERRLAGGWWFGAEWSILDVYLAWITGMCEGAGMDLAGYPALADHARRTRQRPGFQRALERERHALEVAGIELPGRL